MKLTNEQNFGIIIEELCDDFEALQLETYNQVMTQVISHCRNLEAGKNLDETFTSDASQCHLDV